MNAKHVTCRVAALTLLACAQTTVAEVVTLSGTVSSSIRADTTFDFAGYDYLLSFSIDPDDGGEVRGCTMWAKKGGNDSDRTSLVMSGLIAAKLTGAHVRVTCDRLNHTASITLD